jgi:hypothetical protein
MYLATAADTEFFNHVVNLIALLHRYNFEQIQEIAVFNLGLKPAEVSFLNSIAKVKVYEIEKVNPDLLTHFIVRKDGKVARGWYAWKLVVLKQALDMFPYVLYIDAGIKINGPLDKLFTHLQKVGYLFVDCTHTLRPRTTLKVKELFELDKPENSFLLDKVGISAGFQGVSHNVYKDYVLPLYQLAHHLEYFEDDGSAPMGFGEARHDQILASIFVNKLGYQILGNFPEGIRYLEREKGLCPFYLAEYASFWAKIKIGENLQYLHFKSFIKKVLPPHQEDKNRKQKLVHKLKVRKQGVSCKKR